MNQNILTKAIVLSYGMDAPAANATKGEINITDAGAVQIVTADGGVYIAVSPQTALLANTAQVTHPYVRSINGSTAPIVNVGGGANQARFRLMLKDGAGNAIQGLVQIGGSADVTGVTVTSGIAQTTTAAPGGGGGPYGLRVLADATGLVDVTLTFNAGGAKNLSFRYGGYQINALAFTVN